MLLRSSTDATPNSLVEMGRDRIIIYKEEITKKYDLRRGVCNSQSCPIPSSGSRPAKKWWNAYIAFLGGLKALLE
jgi:hypothetical protein